MFSQKESVYAAVKAFLDEKNIQHDDGQKVELGKDDRKTVVEMIAQAAMTGNMQFTADAKAKFNTIEKMREYCGGLLSNWLRKDLRLNGNVEYKAKNPGSRAGQGDDVIRNLKALRSTITEQSHLTAIDAEIEKRKGELTAAKAKDVQIDFSKIPQDLLAKLGK